MKMASFKNEPNFQAMTTFNNNVGNDVTGLSRHLVRHNSRVTAEALATADADHRQSLYVTVFPDDPRQLRRSVCLLLVAPKS
jgi:hypothetical protein